MSEPVPIPLLSSLWWVGFGPSALSVVVGLAIGSRLNDNSVETVSRWIGTIGLIRFVVAHATWMAIGVWNLQEYLPLHMCSLAYLLSVILLLRPRQLLYEFVYYWGIAGSFHALLTPVLNLGLGPIQFFDHYFGHVYIMFVALWATFIMGMRPRPGSWWKVLLWTQLALPVIGGIDWLLGANYMYLAAPPPAENPFIMGEFPWHIFGYQFAAALHLILLYLPWALLRRRPAAVPA